MSDYWKINWIQGQSKRNLLQDLETDIHKAFQFDRTEFGLFGFEELAKMYHLEKTRARGEWQQSTAILKSYLE